MLVGEPITFTGKIVNLTAEALTISAFSDLLGAAASGVSCTVNGVAAGSTPFSLSASNHVSGGNDEAVCSWTYAVPGRYAVSGKITNALTVSLLGRGANSSSSLDVSVKAWDDGARSIRASISTGQQTAHQGEAVTISMNVRAFNGGHVSADLGKPFEMTVSYRDGTDVPTCTYLGNAIAIEDIVLAPDDSQDGGPDEVVCTANYVITAADAQAGVAVASLAVSPGMGRPVTSDTAVITIVAGD